MEFRDTAPPPGRVGRPRTLWAGTVAELRANPSKWGKLKTFPAASRGAQNLAHTINTGRMATFRVDPAVGRFEARVERTADGTQVVWAVFNPAAPAVAP